MVAKRTYTLSETRRLRVTRGVDYWVDENAEPNGIGSVCLFCHLLIDLRPDDHAADCPTRKD